MSLIGNELYEYGGLPILKHIQLGLRVAIDKRWLLWVKENDCWKHKMSWLHNIPVDARFLARFDDCITQFVIWIWHKRAMAFDFVHNKYALLNAPYN